MNIESKIDAEHPNKTRGVAEFVARQHALFTASAYARAITVRPRRRGAAAKPRAEPPR